MSGATRESDRVFLAVFTALALWLLAKVLGPYVKTILLAAVFALLLDPLQARCTRLCGGSPARAAGLVVLITALLVLLPLGWLLTLLTLESIDLYARVNTMLESGQGLQGWLEAPLVVRVRETLDRYFSKVGGVPVDFKAKVAEAVQAVAGKVIVLGQGLAADAAGMVASFFLMLFVLYYLLLDGRRLGAYLVETLPFPEDRAQKLAAQFRDVLHAAFVGSLGVALAQGVLGGVALGLTGFQGVFWGLIMSFASLIPMVGTALVWVPAAAYLFFTGHPVAGTFLATWCVVVVGMADNFLRPLFMSGTSGLHPLLVLFSVLGGMSLFGVLGIFFGPLAVALSLTVVDMFREEFGVRGAGAETP